MNPTIRSAALEDEVESRQSAPIPTRTLLWRIELCVFAVVITLLNLPLLTAGFASNFVFEPTAVSAGEWWRVITHLFVHVSLYHALLNASVFFLLYTELRNNARCERFAFLLAAGAGSLLVSLWAAPMIQTRGLCGLSGIAHGLATVSALETMRGAKNRTLWWLGLASLLLVVSKSLIEGVTGRIAFESLHFGQLGYPIAVCHAGGVLGALLAWLGFGARRVQRREK